MDISDQYLMKAVWLSIDPYDPTREAPRNRTLCRLCMSIRAAVLTVPAMPQRYPSCYQSRGMTHTGSPGCTSMICEVMAVKRTPCPRTCTAAAWKQYDVGFPSKTA